MNLKGFFSFQEGPEVKTPDKNEPFKWKFLKGFSFPESSMLSKFGQAKIMAQLSPPNSNEGLCGPSTTYTEVQSLPYDPHSINLQNFKFLQKFSINYNHK